MFKRFLIKLALYLFAGFMFLIGLIFTISNANLRSKGIKVDAKCISVRTNIAADGNSYYPTVKFVTLTGDTVETELGDNSSYAKGDFIPIMYLEDSPKSSAGINSFFSMYVFPSILLVLGGIFLLSMITGKFDIDSIEKTKVVD